MTNIDCYEQTSFWPVLIFWVGVAGLSVFYYRRFQLSIQDTLLVMIGVRTVDESAYVFWFKMLTLLAVLSLWVYLIKQCAIEKALGV